MQHGLPSRPRSARGAAANNAGPVKVQPTNVCNAAFLRWQSPVPARTAACCCCLNNKICAAFTLTCIAAGELQMTLLPPPPHVERPLSPPISRSTLARAPPGSGNPDPE